MEILAREEEALLESEGVARPEAARNGAGADEALGERVGALAADQELVAELPRVAGSADEDPRIEVRRDREPDPPGPVVRGSVRRVAPRVVELELGEVPAERALEEAARARSLDGEEGEPGVPTGDLGVRAAMLTQDLLDLVGPGRVRDDQVGPRELVTGVDPADQEVVHDPSQRLEEERVADLRRGEPFDVRGRSAGEEGGGVAAVHAEQAHVGYVEEPGPRPHRAMLGEDARVVERHLPAGEGDEMGSVTSVELVERGPAQRGRGRAGSAHETISLRRPSARARRISRAIRRPELIGPR